MAYMQYMATWLGSRSVRRKLRRTRHTRYLNYQPPVTPPVQRQAPAGMEQAS